MFTELVKKNRSIRFYDDTAVSVSELRSLIDDARLSSSTLNKQVVRYILITDTQLTEQIFNMTNLPTKAKVPLQNRPKAFVVMIVDKDLQLSERFLYYNIGIATQNLTLSATEKELGCIVLHSISFDDLDKLLKLDSQKKSVSLIGIGKPIQKVAIANIGASIT
jgi:nitroreductase